MEGFLAYDGDTVAGWMNAQPYQAALRLEQHAGPEPPLFVPRHEVGAIVWVVAPAHRRAGVAAALLAGTHSPISGSAAFARRRVS